MPFDDDFNECGEFDEESAESADAASGDVLSCPSCGELVYDDTQKCPYCGDWIMPVAAAGRPMLWIRIVGALLVLALLFAIGRFLL